MPTKPQAQSIPQLDPKGSLIKNNIPTNSQIPSRPSIPAWLRFTPTRITRDGHVFGGLISLCLLIGLLLPGRNGNVPFFAALLLGAILVVSRFLGAGRLRNISISRRINRRAFALKPLEIHLRLFNESKLPVASLSITETLVENQNENINFTLGKQMIEALPNNPSEGTRSTAESFEEKQQTPTPSGKTNTFIPLLSGKESASTSIQITVRRRGIYKFTPIRLETSFPFGLFRHAVLIDVPGLAIIYPRLGRIEKDFLQELEHSQHSLQNLRPGREEFDFRGLRDYRPNDNPKWIHWPSSAKRNKLMVREFEEPKARRITVIIDTNLRQLGARRTFALEAILSFAGTLALEMARRRCGMVCLAFSNGQAPVYEEMDEKSGDPTILWDFLSGIQPDNSRTLSDWKGKLRTRFLHDSIVLVLGMGSLPTTNDLQWLKTGDNSIRVLDVRSDEFRRIFRRGRKKESGSNGKNYSDLELLIPELDESEEPDAAFI